MVEITRQRHARKHSTYMCFFDAKQAYDSLPHDLLLHRLLQKGVRGKAFAVIDHMYAAASSLVRVGGALSDAFPVRRGVAQGCPLSPLLYAVFIDSVLEHLDAVSLPEADAITVGSPAASRQWRGQLYADDLAAGAATVAGLRQLIAAVHQHSLLWGWTLNVPKTHVVVFGGRAARACAADFRWGGEQLARVACERYLGVYLEEDCSWRRQTREAADKGRRAVYVWRQALASPWLPVNAKRMVIHTRIAPCMWYAMEVWTPAAGGAAIDDVLLQAARLAVGTPASEGVPAFTRVRAISPDVIRADMGILPAVDVAALAHARHRARTLRADAGVLGTGTEPGVDPAARESRLAANAPDVMGAAVRSAASAWSARADRALLDALRWCPDPAVAAAVAADEGLAEEPLVMACTRD